ncbi:hypothetical protein RND71_042407 [Anisodus tanguticus]|uniref:Uncharacterized protein n=1 Tax=Anisodus tanguticus TaxID=243964 RepID=A0AAE1QQW4_9SOLA|nr:hypothetical protein RND71_042407 [Anisodus tanguticus]
MAATSPPPPPSLFVEKSKNNHCQENDDDFAIGFNKYGSSEYATTHLSQILIDDTSSHWWPYKLPKWWDK